MQRNLKQNIAELTRKRDEEKKLAEKKQEMRKKKYTKIITGILKEVRSLREKKEVKSTDQECAI